MQLTSTLNIVQDMARPIANEINDNSVSVM